MNFPIKYRPKRFSDVVGQQSDLQVLKAILERDWIPPAILFQGPFGTGKTSMARLLARALLCAERQGVEPCGGCENCKAMDADNHLAYTEIDAASHGLVGDVRNLKDAITDRLAGGPIRILCFDEAHMLSTQAQNALLQTLEEGAVGVIFMMATTDPNKMLPTIRSRCVELGLRLLTAAEITERLKKVCEFEQIEFEEKALRVMATYVKGHVRDSLVLLEQISKVGGKITEELVRTYLRLDRNIDVYNFLTLKDKVQIVEKLEVLLCNYSISELVEVISQALVDAYKVKIGIDSFTQVDKSWLQKVAEAHGDQLLSKAERIFRTDTDAGTISYGVALIVSAVFENITTEKRELGWEGLPRPQAAGRKPGKDATG